MIFAYFCLSGFVLLFINGGYCIITSIPRIRIVKQDCCIENQDVSIECTIQASIIDSLRIFHKGHVVHSETYARAIRLTNHTTVFHIKNIGFKHNGQYTCQASSGSYIAALSTEVNINIAKKYSPTLNGLPVVRIQARMNQPIAINTNKELLSNTYYSVDWVFNKPIAGVKHLKLYQPNQYFIILPNNSLLISNLTEKVASIINLGYGISCQIVQKCTNRTIDSCSTYYFDISSKKNTYPKPFLLPEIINKSILANIGDTVTLFCPIISGLFLPILWKFKSFDSKSESPTILLYNTNYITFKAVHVSLSGSYTCSVKQYGYLNLTSVMYLDIKEKNLLLHKSYEINYFNDIGLNLYPLTCPISQKHPSFIRWINPTKPFSNTLPRNSFMSKNNLVLYYEYLTNNITVLQCIVSNKYGESTSLFYIYKYMYEQVSLERINVLLHPNHISYIFNPFRTNEDDYLNCHWYSYPEMKIMPFIRVVSYENNLLKVNNDFFADSNQFLCIYSTEERYHELHVTIDIFNPNLIKSINNINVSLGEPTVLTCYTPFYKDIRKNITWQRNNSILNRSNYEYIIDPFDSSSYSLKILRASYDDDSFFTCITSFFIHSKYYSIQSDIKVNVIYPPKSVEMENYDLSQKKLSWKCWFCKHTHVNYVIQYADLDEFPDVDWYEYANLTNQNFFYLDRFPPAIPNLGYRVIACNIFGCSPPSSFIKINSNNQAPSILPSEVKFEPYNTSAVMLTWKSLPFIELKNLNGSYLVSIIMIRNNKDITKMSYIIEKTINQLIIDNLTTDIVVFANVSTVNNFGIGPEVHEHQMVYTSPSKPTPLIAPTVLTSDCGSSQAYIEWSYPTSDLFNIDGFAIQIEQFHEINPSNISSTLFFIENVLTKQHHVNLTPGTLNIVSVASYTKPRNIGPFNSSNITCYSSMNYSRIIEDIRISSLTNSIMVEWTSYDKSNSFFIKMKLFTIENAYSDHKKEYVKSSELIPIHNRAFTFQNIDQVQSYLIELCIYQHDALIDCYENTTYTLTRRICQDQTLSLYIEQIDSDTVFMNTTFNTSCTASYYMSLVVEQFSKSVRKFLQIYEIPITEIIHPTIFNLKLLPGEYYAHIFVLSDQYVGNFETQIFIVENRWKSFLQFNIKSIFDWTQHYLILVAIFLAVISLLFFIYYHKITEFIEYLLLHCNRRKYTPLAIRINSLNFTNSKDEKQAESSANLEEYPVLKSNLDEYEEVDYICRNKEFDNDILSLDDLSYQSN